MTKQSGDVLDGAEALLALCTRTARINVMSESVTLGKPSRQGAGQVRIQALLDEAQAKRARKQTRNQVRSKVRA